MWVVFMMFCFFFFQAEDGIRDLTVTGVQTCALPILSRRDVERYADLGALRAVANGGRIGTIAQRETERVDENGLARAGFAGHDVEPVEIGRASCRERV